MLAQRRRVRLLETDPVSAPGTDRPAPGLVAGCGLVGLALLFLICYHLAIGVDTEPLGRRLTALLLAGVSAGSAAAVLVLLGRTWSLGLANVGMGLICLAVCCTAFIFVPSEPVDLARRYPLLFNALLFSLALMVWFWSWLSRVWVQQLDDGVPWTTAGRMIAPATNVAFACGVIAVAISSLMAIWPRLAVVPTMDHTIGRISAGVAGHLALLAAMLWSARKLNQPRFVVLAVLTTAAMLAFIYIRTVPLTTAVF